MNDRDDGPNGWSMLWVLVQEIRVRGLGPVLGEVYDGDARTGTLLALAITLSATVVLLLGTWLAEVLLGLG